MGITGLIPFLSKSSRRANVKEYAGETVAIDAYCWLHKGAFSCADKLVMNEPTLLYVSYCMKFLNMLLSHNIKPILVFDGRHLPAKSETEKKRRESREINRKKGAELMRAGQINEGRNYLRRSLDVTHEMALNLIKECRKKNIDCIVAPHEADAQLAYLNIKNIAQVVITEDSDLLLFDCVKVLFKMDINGNGLLIEKNKLHISMGIRHDCFNIDKFRQMCILSGCDYLPSLPGIGLGKARKFIIHHMTENIYEALLKIPSHLKMWGLTVTDDYRDAFMEAEKTFKYQLVYDPIKRIQVPLNETENENDIVGEKLSEDVAFQLAVGNLDPMTLKQMDFYHPDKVPAMPNLKNSIGQNQSIWNRNFTVGVTKPKNSVFPVHSSTKGITISTSLSPAVKRQFIGDVSPEPQMSKDALFRLYGGEEKECKIEEEASEWKLKKTSLNDIPGKSQILFSKKIPFALKSSLNSPAKKRRMSSLNRFEFDYDLDNLVTSRYFTSPECNTQLPLIQDSSSTSDVISDYLTKEIVQGENFSSLDKLDSKGELNKELDNSSSEIQKKLSKFTFKGEKHSNDEDDEMKCSQEENVIKHSYEESVEIDKKKSFSSLKFSTHEKTVLTSLNRTACTNKTFYESDKFLRNCDNVTTSPYFAHKSKGKDAIPVISSTPITATKTPSLVRNSKISSKSIAKKFNSGMQQSLLTRFGFQPRAKLQKEKT